VISLPPYVDTCILLSLLVGDHGFKAAETWLSKQDKQPIWISHWVLLELAGVISRNQRREDFSAVFAVAIRNELENFRSQTLSLIEPRANHFMQARRWLDHHDALKLRSGDALHLAIAKHQNLKLITADRQLANAAEFVGCPFELI